MAMVRKPFHETVAENLIEQLKAGTAPWQKPWEPGLHGYMPMNPTTGKRYKGINAIYLMAQDRSESRWMTYKQAQAVGAQVRRGEKGTTVQYWKFSEEQDKLDDNGKPVLDGEGKRVKETVLLERPRVFFATVFNGEQVDGLPPLERKEQTWNAKERAEHILTAAGADIRHGQHDRAFYRPATDSIHLPDKGQFPTADNYYATALHELGHWTGHRSRLDRDLSHPFGSEGYAREELRAEISSMVLGAELGIGHDPEQHAAYVGSWIKALEEDPLEIFRAAADAEKISDYVLSFEQKQIQEQEQAQTQTQEESPEQTREAGMKKAARKTAEAIAILNDSDMQRRIADHEQKQGQQSQQNQAKQERTYIDVPFREKDEAKGLGARWDRSQQSWYVPPGVDTAPFAKWAQGGSQGQGHAQSQNQRAQERLYLAVPYRERGAAKAAGAKWDSVAKSWYAGPGADTARLNRWLAENVQGQQGPAMSPREEFAEALKLLGCVVSGEHPIMDGQKHRISVEGDKRGERAGFYVGHLDGHPAGYIKNNRTGVDMKWRSKGYSLEPKEKAKLQAEAAEKLAARAAEQARQQEATAQRVSDQAANLVPVSEPTPYMQHKGITPHPGVLTDAEGQTIYIPANDANGKHWTTQYIQGDGQKRFAKDGRKEGCFHAVGGMDAVAKTPALVISEGYATAATNAEVLGFATVAAFDSGNLGHVAKALHEKFPNKPIVILGDDDRHLEATQGINPGKVKAKESAQAVGGKAVFPVFAPGEADYPMKLEPVTPQSYREHLRATKALETAPEDRKAELIRAQLSDEQLAALDKMKRHTDFNDLATKSRLGRDGVERQVRASVGKSIQEAEQKRENQQVQNQEQKRRRSVRIG